ncbi:MAG: translation elongation factor Ts [Candidatus Sumerlaeaceae bacterium]|nr:translation elongation factor Ts [Candidatus Sumerlaeaceae bacterium]
MAEITSQMVKELREKSGAGMMDCKKALGEAEGDMAKAMNLLRERGAAIASKRSSRAAKEGMIAAYITPDRKTGALAELNCESDFVARNDDFQAMVATLAKHTAGVANLAEMMASKLEGAAESLEETIKTAIGKIGENIVFSRWARLKAGEEGKPAGLIYHYIHPPGKIGVLVDVATSNDSLAKDPAFEEFARDIAMHIAASSPICVRRAEVPSGALDNEKEIFRKQALNEGKPEKIVEKIIEGRLQKYYAEVCLLEQPFAKNPDLKVEEYMKQNAGKFGDVSVTRFVRYRLGETAEAAAE